MADIENVFAKQPERAEIRKTFEKLIAEHRESLHEDDREAILETVEGDFDVGKARTLLETLPKNLSDAKKRYEDLKKAYEDSEYGPMLREKFGEMSEMTFQEKVEAEEAIARAKKIDIKMKEWEIAGIIAPANRRFKLGYFIGLPSAEQEKIQHSLSSILNIENRKRTLDKFLELPESIKKEHFKEFRELPEEERKALLKKLEEGIEERREELIDAYREKMEGMQEPDENGLSLFATKSIDLYMQWFEALPVTGENSMETYLAHSHLDNPERSSVRNKMAKLLETVTDPKKRTALQEEFNSADLAKRKENLSRGLSKDEKHATDTEREEPSALARGKAWLKGKLQNLHLLPKSDETKESVQIYAIFGEVAERRHRAELRYHRLSREGLEEAVTDRGGDIAKKVENERKLDLDEDLFIHHDSRASVARALKSELGSKDSINVKARLLTEEDREVTSYDDYRHTVLNPMEEDVRDELGETVLESAVREGVEISEKQVREAMQQKDMKRLGEETLRHAA